LAGYKNAYFDWIFKARIISQYNNIILLQNDACDNFLSATAGAPLAVGMLSNFILKVSKWLALNILYHANLPQAERLRQQKR
jgi:hypothetical protein